MQNGPLLKIQTILIYTHIRVIIIFFGFRFNYIVPHTKERMRIGSAYYYIFGSCFHLLLLIYIYVVVSLATTTMMQADPLLNNTEMFWLYCTLHFRETLFILV